MGISYSSLIKLNIKFYFSCLRTQWLTAGQSLHITKENSVMFAAKDLMTAYQLTAKVSKASFSFKFLFRLCLSFSQIEIKKFD